MEADTLRLHLADLIEYRFDIMRAPDIDDSGAPRLRST